MVGKPLGDGGSFNNQPHIITFTLYSGNLLDTVYPPYKGIQQGGVFTAGRGPPSHDHQTPPHHRHGRLYSQSCSPGLKLPIPYHQQGSDPMFSEAAQNSFIKLISTRRTCVFSKRLVFFWYKFVYAIVFCMNFLRQHPVRSFVWGSLKKIRQLQKLSTRASNVVLGSPWLNSCLVNQTPPQANVHPPQKWGLFLGWLND